MKPSRLSALVIMCLVGAGPVAAQESQTREQELLQQRSAKAKELTPYKPGKLEKYLVKVENDRLLERLLKGSDKGFYPFFGTIVSGSGIAIGPGYRNKVLFNRRATFTAFSALSMKKYWIVEGKLDFHGLPASRSPFFGQLFAQKFDFPQEDFFGIGPASRRGDYVSFSHRGTVFGGSGGVHVRPWLDVGTALDYSNPHVGRGKDSLIPSIEVLFSDQTAPGLARQPDFLRYETYVDLDYREPRGNPRAGGRYKAAYSWYNDRDFDQYSFRRLTVDLQQYLSVLQQRRVLALHAYTSLSDADAGQQVPFYLQETLGGSHTLRSFRRFRFRDRNILILQAEYRWEILPALDAALFYDTGKVFSDRSEFNLNHLETGYGFGFRFGTNRRVFLRIDSAVGGTGAPHIHIRFSHAF